jgi:anti-sigma B factor antagonist
VTSTHCPSGPAEVITVRGDLDAGTAPALRTLTISLIAAGRRFLVLDLSAVPYADSIGLGVIVGALSRARRHDGGVTLVIREGSHLAAMFAASGLERVFMIRATVEEAVAELTAMEGEE